MTVGLIVTKIGSIIANRQTFMLLDFLAQSWLILKIFEHAQGDLFS